MDLIFYRQSTEQLRRFLYNQMPCVDMHGKTVRLHYREALTKGFWRKLNVTGSQMPESKINSALVHEVINGQPHLIVFGGTNINVGATDFEVSHANLESLKWKRIEYNGMKFGLMKKEFSLPLGATMLSKTNNEFYLFSGQTPMQNMHSKVRVCPPELYKFEVK